MSCTFIFFCVSVCPKRNKRRNVSRSSRVIFIYFLLHRLLGFFFVYSNLSNISIKKWLETRTEHAYKGHMVCCCCCCPIRPRYSRTPPLLLTPLTSPPKRENVRLNSQLLPLCASEWARARARFPHSITRFVHASSSGIEPIPYKNKTKQKKGLTWLSAARYGVVVWFFLSFFSRRDFVMSSISKTGRYGRSIDYHLWHHADLRVSSSSSPPIRPSELHSRAHLPIRIKRDFK